MFTAEMVDNSHRFHITFLEHTEHRLSAAIEIKVRMNMIPPQLHGVCISNEFRCPFAFKLILMKRRNPYPSLRLGTFVLQQFGSRQRHAKFLCRRSKGTGTPQYDCYHNTFHVNTILYINHE